MISLEDIQKTIKWLRDTTNDNVIYIDKDLKIELGNTINDLLKLNEIYKSKIELGNTINDLLKLNEIYKSKIDKAIEYIKKYRRYASIGEEWFERSFPARELLEILGDKE